MHKTREEWLLDASRRLEPLFEKAGKPIPSSYHVSVGFPSTKALSLKSRRLGEAWTRKVSGNGMAHVFLSPVISEPLRLLDILLHELVHVAVGNECGHRGAFASTAKALGLVGEMTATTAGPELVEELRIINEALGAYPQDTFNPSETLRPTKKQSTRMLKVACPDCGYTVRTTEKWISVGLPSCPCGAQMERD